MATGHGTAKDLLELTTLQSILMLQNLSKCVRHQKSEGVWINLAREYEVIFELTKEHFWVVEAINAINKAIEFSDEENLRFYLSRKGCLLVKLEATDKKQQLQSCLDAIRAAPPPCDTISVALTDANIHRMTLALAKE